MTGIDHPAWCTRCTAAQSGAHRGDQHEVPPGSPVFWWWLQQWGNGPTLVALSSGDGPIWMPASQLPLLAVIIEEVATADDGPR